MSPARASATTNQSTSNRPVSETARAVPRATAVYDHRRTGIIRNSRNHPRAFFRPPPATGETIEIVILDGSAIGGPITWRGGAGLGSMVNKRLWHLIAGTRGGVNPAKI